MKLEGDLQEIDLVPHLLALAAERFTGAIRFENDGIIKILYFKEGDVLSASTNDRADSVDEILLRAGKVNRDHIRQALGKRKDNETLGDALLSLGFISRKELAWGRRTQIVGILRSVRGWGAGSYQIVHDYLPNREEGTLFYLPQIILELAVTDPDKSGVETRIEGGAAIFRKVPGFAERYARLALNEDADAIVEQIDGEKTAAEVAAVSKLDVFAAYKLLLALEALGMTERDKPQAIHEVYTEGDEAPIPESLGDLPGSPAPLLPMLDAPAGAVEDGGPPEPHPDPSWSAPDLGAAATEVVGVPEPETVIEEEPAAREEAGAVARRRSPALLIVALVVLLAAAAWGAWTWWSGRETPGDVAAPTPRRIAKVAPPVEPAAIDSAPTATIPATPGGTAATATAEVPPVGAPMAAAPAAGDAERARYQGMAEEFARERASVAYTVQFELVCQTESVRRAMAAGAAVWFVPVQYRGASCFRVFWGAYPTREEAEKAKGEIPAALRGSGPVVVRPRELLR